MSSIGEWMNAMVALRNSKLREEEYKAARQDQGMEALGQGIGGLLKGVGSNMSQSRQDAIANRLMNQSNPPRAMAVDPSLQGAADAQLPAGDAANFLPATGGMDEWKMQQVQEKGALAQEKVRNAQELGLARIGQGMTEAELRATKTQAQIEKWNNDTALAQKRLELRQQQAKQQNDVNSAKLSLSQASPKFQQDLKDQVAYQNQMKVALAAAAGAKTPEDYDKAVSLITSNYAVGEKHGYKVSYPQVPIPGYQRDAQKEIQDQIARLQGQKEAAWGWTGGKAAIDAQISLKQKQLPEGYDPNYTPPGLQPWDIPDVPNLDDYLKPAQTQLNQAGQPQQAGGTGTGDEQTISLEEAQKNMPNAQSGDVIHDKFGNSIRVQ